MAKEMVRKGVAFNILDPDQAKLLEHASSRLNFSAYVKRLIQRDMEGGMNQEINIRNEIEATNIEVNIDDFT